MNVIRQTVNQGLALGNERLNNPLNGQILFLGECPVTLQSCPYKNKSVPFFYTDWPKGHQ
jgi:hypothetical protein